MRAGLRATQVPAHQGSYSAGGAFLTAIMSAALVASLVAKGSHLPIFAPL